MRRPSADVFSSAALGIDYSENGYRFLVAMGLQTPALLHSVLAVSAAHLSRLQGVPDTTSAQYYRRALRCLQNDIADETRHMQESTCAAMLCLSMYEVGSGPDNSAYSLLISVPSGVQQGHQPLESSFQGSVWLD
jgi:hypothetical protein